MKDLQDIYQAIARQEFYLGLARRGHKRYVPIEADLERDLETLMKQRDSVLNSNKNNSKSDDL